MHLSNEVVVELVATSKRSIPKSALATFEPDVAYALSRQSLGVLRSWLTARYNRTAFPDTFNDRMARSGVDQKLDKTVAKYGSLISSVYFILDAGQSIERSDGNPYELSIVLVYPPGDDAQASGKAAAEVADAIYEACLARLKDKKAIDLKACMALSEDDLTVGRARVMAQWRLEHVTLKADGAQPGPVSI